MAVLTPLNLEAHLPATFTAPGLSEADFLALCELYRDCTLEYTSDGTVIVMPPTNPKNSERVVEVVSQLRNWARARRPGHVVGPDGGFFLPDGSRRSPDAAWFDADRWKAAETPGTVFPTFAPDFVIEVRSPGQRQNSQREKMEDYIVNGVQLGWLIDPVTKNVEIYRPGRDPEILTNPASISGEGPVEGFLLDLSAILN
jgi:Uma2 family endonuclease